MLKRIKNLEDKADNQLSAIENQGDRQLDLIDEINNRRNRRIGFKSDLARLGKEIIEKEAEISKNKRIKKEDSDEKKKIK